MVTREAFIAVYILASQRHGTLYVGVTSDLPTRTAQHREGTIEGFTKRYSVKRLVWFEPHDIVTLAIRREKAIKKYKRERKVNLIERENPAWEDLYPRLFL
jgi:putative endonuclease